MSAPSILLKVVLFAVLAGLCLWLLAGAGPQPGDGLAMDKAARAARGACWVSIF
ncbi:hypothetical protein [Amphiplicatus metriothermophilus]|uniref:Uncharacterized protein n=1 Tax=Amphiplicatus metriothermophilus TaxID=1519374 RepID=A0A239Q0T4_9PROT|nr:hypothetical protein [Amphiplicatus metriothermophilus]MBB5520028.1 hypothetical protein [Amphiplicatus metriothermophilus]SNT76040.1 hypothetical protein SAMN06297382_3021 [Amphiplicatus metriothermophilus]